MTAPGGDHDEANTPPTGSPIPERADREAPWAPPSTGDTAYPPPGHVPEYPADYQPGYPSGSPPPMPPPPGFQQPPAYGGPPYPPPGYGPPSGYPGGYYPGPDYPGGYGPQGGFPGAAQPGTNGLAIASLISSFAGVFCCVGSIAAIVLGTIALDQIKRNRQEGYGLAVAGIVIGIAGLVVTLIVVIFAMNSR